MSSELTAVRLAPNCDIWSAMDQTVQRVSSEGHLSKLQRLLLGPEGTTGNVCHRLPHLYRVRTELPEHIAFLLAVVLQDFTIDYYRDC